MKDNRFIELVNLYIDRQITAAEAAELEAEMQASPRRRAIYRQYCQMHRATTLVYESFRTHAAGQQPEVAASLGNITRFESQPQHRRVRWAYYAGGLAAACVALVFIRLNFSGTADTNLAATAKSTPSVAVINVRPAPATPREISGAQPRLVGLPNNDLVAEQDYAAMLRALRQQEQRALANGQLQAGQLPSLFDDGVFESQPGSPVNNQRVFRGRQTPAQQAEFTAFQFQR